jgi:hypothetical protein
MVSAQESESLANERENKIRCDCGNWLSVDTDVVRVSCECGETFAVTVTKL